MLKNIFYYWFGIVVMILVKTKTAFFGYVRPRPIMKSEIDKNLIYDYRVIDDFRKRLTGMLGYEYDFNGKNVLEIGPGPDLGTGLLFKSLGVTNYTGVDRFELISDNDDFYNALLASLDDSKKHKVTEIVALIKKALKSNKSGIVLPGFEYLNVPVEKISEKLNLKYDFIFSNAVLEHVEDVEKAFVSMYESLKPDGIMYHEIDFQTHTGLLRDRDPLNILRYQEKIYNLLRCDGSPNRLRLSDYIRMAKTAGFKDIKYVINNKIQEVDVLKVKKSLTSGFAKREVLELGILSGGLTIIK